jgi:hypothetical protein
MGSWSLGSLLPLFPEDRGRGAEDDVAAHSLLNDLSGVLQQQALRRTALLSIADRTRASGWAFGGAQSFCAGGGRLRPRGAPYPYRTSPSAPCRRSLARRLSWMRPPIRALEPQYHRDPSSEAGEPSGGQPHMDRDTTKAFIVSAQNYDVSRFLVLRMVKASIGVFWATCTSRSVRGSSP